jgi:hypothetical protein
VKEIDHNECVAISCALHGASLDLVMCFKKRKILNARHVAESVFGGHESMMMHFSILKTCCSYATLFIDYDNPVGVDWVTHIIRRGILASNGLSWISDASSLILAYEYTKICFCVVLKNAQM